ncbi:hypothetical protein DKP76_16640 [Falsochrobactrum shanghaiense]|uniref:Uncharacterized protein n=2 Tax=Falsochrobactrum shanghaiense TaxID=2201899 RepID=A0A316J5E0_9HYPH|nr:hypothetical protein DKP76_16640 [Falsochrobactrum shanghaiense]
MNFAALVAIAAVTVTQILRARDNPSGQVLADTFDPDERPLLLAICKGYEGEVPTSCPRKTLIRRTLLYSKSNVKEWVCRR